MQEKVNTIAEEFNCSLYKVVAYVTAYKDKTALHKCIEAINTQDYQVRKIVVVDNSPVALLGEDEENILVWFYPDNIGISGGLSKMMFWAKNRSYDFVWMFDQDSIPSTNCLTQLIQAYDRLVIDRSVGIVAPTPIDHRTQRIVEPACFVNDRFRGVELPRNGQIRECDSPITSGSLLWLNTLDTVSPPDVRLIIDGIDLDYGLRLRQAGYGNFLIPQATMSHNFGSPRTLCFLGRQRVFQTYSAFRYFYICRNHTYLEMSFSQGVYKLTCSLRRIKFLCSQIFWLLLVAEFGECAESKPKKIWACLRGTYHGFCGSLDQHFYGRNRSSPVKSVKVVDLTIRSEGQR